MVYEIDDKIGRSDSRDKAVITAMSVSTTAARLPASPLGRRNFIRVKNMDAAKEIAILTISGTTVSGGYSVAAGGEWEENTDAEFWAITTAGTVDVRIYERAERFNYRN